MASWRPTPQHKGRLTTYNVGAGEVNESYGSGEHGHRKISCNPGPPEKTIQAVLVSFRDIMVSECIIIHNPPSYYMLHHCTTHPDALKSYCAASIILCLLAHAFLKCPCNRQKNLQSASVWATRPGKCSRSLLLGSLWQVGLEKMPLSACWLCCPGQSVLLVLHKYILSCTTHYSQGKLIPYTKSNRLIIMSSILI